MLNGQSQFSIFLRLSLCTKVEAQSAVLDEDRKVKRCVTYAPRVLRKEEDLATAVLRQLVMTHRRRATAV